MRQRDLLTSFLPALGGAAVVTQARASQVAPEVELERSTAFVVAGDGTRLFYRDWRAVPGKAGSGAAGTVMFVAPWALHSDWFECQMTALADAGLRCVAYDRRGHGRSDEPGRGDDFDTLTDDLRVVIDRLALRDVTLVVRDRP